MLLLLSLHPHPACSGSQVWLLVTGTRSNFKTRRNSTAFSLKKGPQLVMVASWHQIPIFFLYHLLAEPCNFRGCALQDSYINSICQSCATSIPVEDIAPFSVSQDVVGVPSASAMFRSLGMARIFFSARSFLQPSQKLVTILRILLQHCTGQNLITELHSLKESGMYCPLHYNAKASLQSLLTKKEGKSACWMVPTGFCHKHLCT